MTHSEQHKQYLVWWQMINRCTNPTTLKYPIYGGRGITVCDRWRESFQNFVADMGWRPTPQHQIERIDNSGPYCPENCRWATRIEQGANKRNNHVIEYRGRTWALNELARHLGIPRCRLTMRLRRGWPIERAASHKPWQRRPEHARKS